MIWVAGRIVRDDELKISVLDRTFEHGLGLFETLRTWNGRAPLLSKHLARMTASAQELDLPLIAEALPDESAVDALLRAEGALGNVVLRITTSGGLTAESGSVVWMRALPLPPATRAEGAAVSIGEFSVTFSDLLVRHKALNYWGRRRAFENARAFRFDEALSTTTDGCVWEGSRTNLFLVEGDVLTTASTRGPIVPGIMRQLVLDVAKELPMVVREMDQIPIKQIFGADELFLTNSVRCLIPVASAHHLGARPGLPRAWTAPGPWTRRLSLMVQQRLHPEGAQPA